MLILRGPSESARYQGYFVGWNHLKKRVLNLMLLITESNQLNKSLQKRQSQRTIQEST